jgi:cation diffusion facilitator family transporter
VRFPGGSELPPDLDRVHRRAVRLEWFTIAYLLTAITFIYFTLGNSQAMKGAWLEDLLSLAPPIAFLVAARVRYRRPNDAHPYGYHRAVEIAYFVASLALLSMGGFLIVDSALTLLSGDHPSIGMVELFDWQVWLGWLMIAALVYSGVPTVVLGIVKRRLAAQLHDKVLQADAMMNQADWMTASAALVGVVGIGFGLWWADAVAAIAIGADILHDGAKYTRAAAKDLLDGRPRRHDEASVHPLVGEVRQVLEELDWVDVAAVRMREEGHVLGVEIIAVPHDEADLLDHVEAAIERIVELDWKMQDVVVSVVRELRDAPEELLVRSRRFQRSASAPGPGG